MPTLLINVIVFDFITYILENTNFIQRIVMESFEIRSAVPLISLDGIKEVKNAISVRQ